MDFNALYKVHEHPWGSKPIQEISEYVDYFKPGTVLDIGVGDGRNVLFLAQRGFRIIGLDIAPLAIERLLATAQDLGIRENVEGISLDVVDFFPTQTYDNVMSNFTLHFLPKADFLPVLTRLQKGTAVGGVHFISDFTQDGPLYKPTTSKYWLQSDELPKLYQGWDILHYAESRVKTRATDEQGNQYTHVAATLVARKVE